MAAKKAYLDLAAKQASTGFLEALCLVEKFLDPSSEEERTLIATKVEGMFPGRIRSPAIYSKVMWFTSEVSAQDKSVVIIRTGTLFDEIIALCDILTTAI